MTRRFAMISLALAALVAVGVVRWRGALPSLAIQPAPVTASSRSSRPPADSVLEEAEDFIVSNDLFRLSNEPTKVRFDPGNENGNVAMGAPPPMLIRPNMTLKGIVGGPPWQAFVDGIPGQPPGTVVQAGAKFDKLTARAVTRDSVIIQGPDTTWVLTFRRM